MYLEPMEMCRVSKVRDSMCVKFLGLPWNVKMVAVVNNTTEAIVKKALRLNFSLVRQLQDPEFCYRRSTKRDLNKRNETPFAVTGAVVWTWGFLKYFDYLNRPQGEVVKDRRHKAMYKNWLSANNLQDSDDNRHKWLLAYLSEVDLRVYNARYGISQETPYEVFVLRYESYKTFDRNKLRPLPSVKPREPTRSTYQVEQTLKRAYISLIQYLPPSHIEEAVRTMLLSKEEPWLQQT